jgi:MFS family permease
MIWAIPGIVVGLAYALWGVEGVVLAPRRRDYRRAVWNDVLKNRAVCALVAVSTLRAMGQTALASFLPLFLSLHLQLPAALAGAYMSILFLFAGIAPAFVGWLSDRFGHRLLIATFSLLSGAAVLSIPYLGAGAILVAGLGLLGLLLWALRPVIVSAAMSAAPQDLSGSIVAFIYGANMSASFLAPLAAGIIADAYGLPVALLAIAALPLSAALLTLSLLKPADSPA